MPSISKTHTENGANGKPSPLGERNGNKLTGLAAHLALRQRTGTDDIEIKRTLDDPDVEAATMADVAKLVASVKYLVPGWIPYGMITGVVAEPGVGKSAFALWLARTVMTGSRWFNGMDGPSKPGYVLWCPTENDMAITLHRMQKWSIPLNRLIMPFKDDPLCPVNLTNEDHLRTIETLIGKHRTRLVVIDSLRSGHDGDENSSRVGRVMQQLAAIAERTNAAIVIVHHTRKLVVDEELTANSSRGSNAILALMRSQIGIDRPDKESKWCRVRVLKENLGLAPNPRGFRVTNKGLEFGQAPHKPKPNTKGQKAADWLTEQMKPGQWYAAAELQAKANDFSENALQRAGGTWHHGGKGQRPPGHRREI